MPEIQLYRVRLRTYAIIKVAEAPPSPCDPITTSASAVAYLLPFYRKEDAGREHFGAIFMNARHRPLAAKILFSGSVAQTAVYPNEIARAALLLGASAVLISHSHPSGDLSVSADDLAVTRRIAEALALVDIRLLDHIILSVEDGRFRVIGVNP